MVVANFCPLVVTLRDNARSLSLFLSLALSLVYLPDGRTLVTGGAMAIEGPTQLAMPDGATTTTCRSSGTSSLQDLEVEALLVRSLGTLLQAHRQVVARNLQAPLRQRVIPAQDGGWL